MIATSNTPASADVDISPRAPRASVTLQCEARQGTRQWQRVLLGNLSETGFRMTGFANPSPGVPLSIKIPGLQVLTARICRQEGAELGCEFASPLYVAVYEHLVKASKVG
ncbi:MAG TPA: PilZ domain-containing protein [Novosphingobium sp.]|nr:PilZ domain-containing protein [Novosphingobium sp.]HNN55196.1 PilZ domain-containing protein [Novosphingobium sp.]